MRLGRLAANAALLATLVVGYEGRALAWEAPYVEDALKKGVKAARAKKDMEGYGPRADGMCLIGGFVELNGWLTWKAKLKKGKEYIFIAAGDRDVKALHLECVEDKEKIAENDDEVPYVDITAEGDADVTLKLKVTDAPEDQYHFNLLIMLEDKAPKGSFQQLENAAKMLNEAVAQIKKGVDFEFDKQKNSICLGACVLGKSGWRSFERSFEAGTNYMILGAGDSNCIDLDLEVSTKGGEQLAKDDGTDATPVVVFNTDKKQTLSTKVTMHDASKSSFAVVAVLAQSKKEGE